MFENIIDQSAVLQLRDDIENNKGAPSMLFFGPPNSGKSSAALELARVLSCEKNGAWTCSCSSCELHRILSSDDLLVLGKRSFAGDIAACQNAFLRNPSNAGAKLLFYRSLRKLLIRFSPVLMEDDPRLSKISVSLQSLDEKLSAFRAQSCPGDDETPEKDCDSMLKDALFLEKEGFGANISIGQIRRASYWCRLAPNGKRKTLIIEGAENMRDEGRNSLLKLLEEPPPSVSIVLTAQRREAIMPTILSRLRPYRFLKRSEESELNVIRRVFQEPQPGAQLEGSISGALKNNHANTGNSLVSAYIGTFLPGSAGKTQPLAAWFLVSFARITSDYIRKKGDAVPQFFNALAERYAQLADSSGLDIQMKGMNVIKTLLLQCNNFKEQSFPDFLKICLDMAGSISRTSDNPEFIAYNDIFFRYISEAVTASEVLNINAAIALENLFYKLKTASRCHFTVKSAAGGSDG